MKNNLIIFSKNRANQLHLLIHSLFKCSNDLFDNINVLYTTSNDEYASGYNKLIESVKVNYPNRINFIVESDFRQDLLNLIDINYEFTTFLVDDVVFFQTITAPKSEVLNKISSETICFSLRLGTNCVYSHPANLSYVLNTHELIDGYLYLDYTQQRGDFAYPLSTDGHIFHTNTINNLLTRTPFRNPNTLEANLQRFVSTRAIPTKLVSFEHSKLVSVPVNLVNDTIVNRHGLKYGISEKELNDRYLNNEIINYDVLDFTNINGPHKEIKYEFKSL